MTVRLADLPFIAIAALELLVARLTLATTTPQGLTEGLALEPSGAASSPNLLPEAVERVSFYIPRVASRLPWRGDCLVQALAARRWLRRLGYETELSLGVRRTDAPLEAHAWLKWGDRIVTGGAVDDYSPFRRSGRA